MATSRKRSESRRRVPPSPQAEPAGEPVIGEPVPPTQGPPAPPAPSKVVTWIDWYNNANPNEQRGFDQAASIIDNGGSAYQKGGAHENFVEQFAGGPLYAPLINYRDTGGRVSLFAVPPKDYGKVPISVVHQGGPIEPYAPHMLVLHPGRYTYTEVTQDGTGFRKWLAIVTQKEQGKAIEAVTVGQTQRSPAVLPMGEPYYTDWEFTVSQDTAWPDNVQGEKLNGIPTWLPPGINIVDYWGQITKLKPDWLAPVRAAEGLLDFGRTVGTVALVAATAYVLWSLKPSDRHQ